MGGTADIVSIRPSILRWLSDYAISDLVDYYNPDAIFVSHEPETDISYEEIRDAFDIPVFYPEKENKRIRHVPINGIDFVVIDGVDTLEVARKLEEAGRMVGDEYVYLLTTDIDVELDTAQLSASLLNQQDYYTHNSETNYSYVYITGSLPSHYRQEWDDMVVQGGQPEENQGGLTLPCLTCHSNGRVGVRTLRTSQLGMRALKSVGRRTTEKLNDHGYETREDVQQVTRSTLREIYGIGEKTANKLWYHSRAMGNNEVKRRSNKPVPGTNPVFIDIETDGVTPTVIWHIGVYDSKDERYRSFLARNPDEGDEVIRSFISWYASERTNQILMSWKGWEFDYHHLDSFISQAAPEYSRVWENATKRDLYYWTSELDNAVLPTRTDNIEEIGRKVGYEGAGTGFTSDHVRRQYRQWMSGRIGEPDWGSMTKYCRDKVMSLVYLYDELSMREKVQAGGSTSN